MPIVKTIATSSLVLSLVVAAGGWLFLAQAPAPLPAELASQTEPAEILSAETSHPRAELSKVPSPPTHQLDPSTGTVSEVEVEDSSEAMAKAIDEMGADAVINRFQEIPLADLRADEGRLLVRRWACLDPHAASKWVLQLGDTEAREELSSAAVLSWSSMDLSGAIDWAHRLPAGALQNRLWTDLSYEVARVHPLESMKLAVELPASESRDALVLHALRQWTAEAAEQSLSWALQLSPGPLREKALAAAVTALASQDGQSAARFVAEHVLPGTELDRAVTGIVQRWAQTDPDRTKAWLDQFPEGPLRENALAAFHEVNPR